MSIDRRDFTKLLATGAAALTVPRRLLGLDVSPLPPSTPRSAAGRARQATFFDWRRISDGIRVAFGQGGNVMLVRDGGEGLVSDSKNLGFGYTLRREAEAHGVSLEYALATHHHGDHIGGLSAFRPDVPVIAHGTARTRIREWAEGVAGRANERLERTVERLRSDDAPSEVIADVERLRSDLAGFAAERLTPSDETGREAEYRVGNRSVQVRHIGPGHTDNDVFLYVPEENVVHTGDLCFNGSHGFMDQNGGVSSEGWQRSVRAIIGLTDGETVVIPGHGEITDRAGLQRQYDYFSQLRDAVAAAIRDGMSKDEVTELRPDALSDIGGSPARNLGVVYDELTGS